MDAARVSDIACGGGTKFIRPTRSYVSAGLKKQIMALPDKIMHGTRPSDQGQRKNIVHHAFPLNSTFATAIFLFAGKEGVFDGSESGSIS
jgi:hypothetical protein